MRLFVEIRDPKDIAFTYNQGTKRREVLDKISQIPSHAPCVFVHTILQDGFFRSGFLSTLVTTWDGPWMVLIRSASVYLTPPRISSQFFPSQTRRKANQVFFSFFKFFVREQQCFDGPTRTTWAIHCLYISGLWRDPPPFPPRNTYKIRRLRMLSDHKTRLSSTSNQPIHLLFHNASGRLRSVKSRTYNRMETR
ncbi:hypothetical protein WAI453_008357 [Rhynchosporium graminicola]